MPTLVALELLQNSRIKGVRDSSNSCPLKKQQVVSILMSYGLGKLEVPVTELRFTAASRAVPAKLVPVKNTKG